MYFNNETLHIFTLVTGPYKAFFDNFIRSIKFFFPGSPKVIHIASDGLDDYRWEGISDDIKDVIVTHIIDLPFPMIPLQKTYMQVNQVTDDMKYVFYFDIDTMFKYQTDEGWKFLEDKIECGNILLSKHPHHDSNHEGYVWNLIEENADSKAFIPEEYNEHIISSFWGGKSEEVLKMDKYVNAMVKYDLRAVRYLPKFVDENYINKIIWQTKKGETNDIKFYVGEHFIQIPDYEFYVPTEHIFLVQKYDNSIKNSKKSAE